VSDSVRAPVPASAGAARLLVVCGDNPLAYRLATELLGQRRCSVTVIVRSAQAGMAPRIARLERVRLIEAPELNVAAYRAAGVAAADALALTDQDDVANIHAALCAQEVNPGLRVVIRFGNMSLGYRIQELFPGSVVLSDSSTAAPSFVAAALGNVTQGSVRLPGRPHRTVFVARRADVPPGDVMCGLADTSGRGGPVRLPADDARADLVLALSDPSDSRSRRHPLRAIARRLAERLAPVRLMFTRKLVGAAVLLLVLLAIGTATFAVLIGTSWPNSVYLTVLDVAGAAQPDLTLSLAAKITQSAITIIGIAIIPVVTAAVVDSVVSARLASPMDVPRRISGHVVLVGLGNVGARVLSQLHELGIPMVAVEKDERARGMPRARRLGVPVVIGDASREDVLRLTQVDTSRALIAVTSDDVTNLEAALHGRYMSPELRVVLRLFDDDLARRVEHTFGIDVSRSVSFLAAPAFAAAMLRRQVLATIPVGRRALLVAEIPIPLDCPLLGRPASAATVAGRSRVLAVQPRGSDNLQLPASAEHPLAAGDRLIVVATQKGLTELSVLASTRPAA
jgi:Trk K+ transport system NAD-binding subunit